MRAIYLAACIAYGAIVGAAATSPIFAPYAFIMVPCLWAVCILTAIEILGVEEELPSPA